MSINKQEFLVPVVLVLKALRDLSDKELYDRLTLGYDCSYLTASMSRPILGPPSLPACPHTLGRSRPSHPPRLVLIACSDEDNTYLVTRVEMLLRESKEFSTFTKTTALAYLGTTHSPPPQMGTSLDTWVW